MTILLQDIRFAFRRWTGRPGFAVTAVITLALGIASTTAIFSVVHAVLIKPLPWRDADELVSIYVSRPHWRASPVLAGSWNVGHLSWPIYKDLQTKSRTLSEAATWNRRQVTLNDARNELVHGLQVSAGFLPMLGVTPYLGRFFTATDDDARSEACVISFEAWQRRYGASPGVIGQRVSLDETPYTIVGVLPPGFDFTGANPPEFLIPWGNEPAANRHAGNHFMYGIGRLRPGIPLAAAVADVDPLVRGDEKPEEKQARLVPLEEDHQGRSRGPLGVLLAASSLLLLIACANVGGLLLGEGGARRYEMAVRIALGGSRRTIVRQLLVESLVLATVATAMAIAVVIWVTPLLVTMVPEQLPRSGEVAVNLPVLSFAIIVGVITALLFGVAPALSISRADPAPWVYGGGRGAVPTTHRVHRVLVAAEVALAVMLVTGASLFGETLLRMTSQPLGFNPDNLVVASLRFPRDRTITPAVRLTRNETLVDRLAALPGVAATTVTSTAPFSGGYGSNGITIDDKPGLEAQSSRHVVSESYFSAVGIPIVKGRGFDATDMPGTYTAVVSREFERQYLDGEAIGKRFTLNDNVHQVIGVVPATKHRRFTDEAGPAMYILNRQLPAWGTPQFIVRTAVDGQSQLAAIRQAIEAAEPQASIVSLETMRTMMRRSVADERFRATLSVGFGVTALLLAAMGLYGMITRLVSDRRREIGVRLALGAQQGAVLRLVLRHAMQMVFAGVLLGVPAALGAASLVRSMLFGVAPTAPHTFVLVVALLTASAGVAAGLPAFRASRTNPAQVLRSD